MIWPSSSKSLPSNWRSKGKRDKPYKPVSLRTAAIVVNRLQVTAMARSNGPTAYGSPVRSPLAVSPAMRGTP